VGVALREGSDVSNQLKSAVAVEMVDWFIQTNWSDQVGADDCYEIPSSCHLQLQSPVVSPPRPLQGEATPP